MGPVKRLSFTAKYVKIFSKTTADTVRDVYKLTFYL